MDSVPVCAAASEQAPDMSSSLTLENAGLITARTGSNQSGSPLSWPDTSSSEF